jgi:hypothetical protein
MSRPTTHELRWFGLVAGASLGIGFDLVLPWLRGTPRPSWPLVAAGVLWTSAVLYPRALAPLHFVSTRVSGALGAVQRRIALTLLYFLFWTPVGLAWRLFDRDPLGLRWDSKADSYREPPRKRPPDRFDKPY